MFSSVRPPASLMRRWLNRVSKYLRYVWYCNIDCLNGYSIRPPSATHTVMFSDTSDVAFGGFSASLDGTVISGMWEPEDIGQSSANWKLFISCCFPTLLDWNTRELKSLLIIRAPPELLLSGAPKLISRLWLWTFLISVLLTASFWKRNGSQGRLMKGQIFSADLLTKMTGPSTLLYFEWLTPMGPSHNRSVCVALQF